MKNLFSKNFTLLIIGQVWQLYFGFCFVYVCFGFDGVSCGVCRLSDDRYDTYDYFITIGRCSCGSCQ